MSESAWSLSKAVPIGLHRIQSTRSSAEHLGLDRGGIVAVAQEAIATVSGRRHGHCALATGRAGTRSRVRAAPTGDAAKRGQTPDGAARASGARVCSSVRPPGDSAGKRPVRSPQGRSVSEAAEDLKIGAVKRSLQEGARAAAVDVDSAVPWAAQLPPCLDRDTRRGRVKRELH